MHFRTQFQDVYGYLTGYLWAFFAFAMATFFATLLVSAFAPGEALWLFLPAVLITSINKKKTATSLIAFSAICVVSYIFSHHIPYALISAFSLQALWFFSLSMLLSLLFTKYARQQTELDSFRGNHKILAAENNGKVVTDVLERFAVFMGVMTPDGILREANKTALVSASLKESEVIGLPFEETYWWSHDTKVQQLIHRSINKAKHGVPSRFDTIARLGDNAFIDIDFMLHPIFDEHGSVIQLIPSGIDITNRKRTERNSAMLTQISADLLSLSSLDKIKTTITDSLVKHLNLSACIFCETHPISDQLTITHHWQSDTDLASFEANGDIPFEVAMCQAENLSLVVNDVVSDPRYAKGECQRRGIGALICVPISLDRKNNFVLAVYRNAPYIWRDDEIDLVIEFARRYWVRTEHLRVLDTLRASKTTLDITLEAAQLGDWELDLTNGRTRRSLHHDRCFGYPEGIPDELWGVSGFFEHVHPDDKAEIKRKFNKSLDQGCDFRGEYRVIWPDKSIHWLAVHASLYGENDGKPTRMLGIVANISERKRTEALLAAQTNALELMAQEASLNDVLETLVLSLEEHSVNGMMGSVMLVDTHTQTLKFTVGPSLPTPYIQHIDGLPINAINSAFSAAAASKHEVFVADIASDPLWSECKDIALKHNLRACWSLPILSGKDVLGIFAMYYPTPQSPDRVDYDNLDIIMRTAELVIKRHQNEQLMHLSEERFRAMADNVPQLAWMANAQGEIEWFNQRWLTFTGASLEQNLHGGWKKHHHPDHEEAVFAKFAACLEQGIDWEDTFPLRGSDGNYRWFLSRMNAIHDHNGTLVRFFGTNTDVTEQRKMAEKLAKITDKLSTADKRKDEFLATLAHELRNPLAPLLNSMELIRNVQSEPAMVQSAVITMERQVKQMVRLIDDLLDISRISKDKLSLKRKQVDLGQIIEHAVEMAMPYVNRLGHNLQVDLPQHTIYMKADPARLAQVLGNLLNNACKYTPKRGEITLSVTQDAEQVQISVKDNGLGITENMRTQVFDLFTQIDQHLEQSEGGLGIGLSLVKRLVEMHGGHVECRSEGLGHGSEFIVYLPCKPVTANPKIVSKKPTKLTPLAALNVLIVDDNQDSADSMQMLLDMHEHKTRVVYDGEQALIAAEQDRPDVILLDIGLPILDGYQVCTAIRKLDWGKDITIIALTGWGQDEDRRKSSEAGFNHHMVKPITLSALLALLAQVTPQTR
ncbi:PAS domain-containing protein [Paraglaciecola sp. L1A13]|uniref:PAS domain-containing protein n=1 Tax=Paraglaciecola sp. L1A13 TaxID=2686359 RepID=UPI00131E4E44|nr:PAS domain-containing protein [Paraglaciecola sp. L1A13]